MEDAEAQHTSAAGSPGDNRPVEWGTKRAPCLQELISGFGRAARGGIRGMLKLHSGCGCSDAQPPIRGICLPSCAPHWGCSLTRIGGVLRRRWPRAPSKRNSYAASLRTAQRRLIAMAISPCASLGGLGTELPGGLAECAIESACKGFNCGAMVRKSHGVAWMIGAPTGFWGKLQKDGERVRMWHPLVDHSADVAACCDALLRRTVLRSRLARLGGQDDLDDVQIARLCVLASLHDIGKFNLGFQNKAIAHPPFVAGHVQEVACLFNGQMDGALTTRLAEAIGARWLAAWSDDRDTALRLLLAAIGHHGRPASICTSRAVQQVYWNPAGKLDPWDGIQALRKSAMAWFPAAEGSPGRPLPNAPEFQHGFSGLVMLADWLGSDDRLFPYSEPHEGDRIELSRERALGAIREIGIQAEPFRRSLGTSPIGFERICEHVPRPAQAATLALPVGTPGGALTILEAETGSGKTEAALIRFLHLLQAGRVDGMYFALPTRTAATQIHKRVVAAVARAFPDPSLRPPVVLAVPGYFAVDDREGQNGLAPFEVLWNDDPTQRYRYRGWAAERPKRYMAGAVVVGTIDQVLLSALTVNHSQMRSTALSRVLLVVDEVHASDAYMTRILEEVLRFHLQAGGQAFLMSATLGSVARDRLLSRVSDGGHLALKDAEALPYPVLVQSYTGSPAQRIPIPEHTMPRSIHCELVPDMGSPMAVASRALAAATAGAKVLVIRNTVSDCIATQIASEGSARDSGAAGLLHRCAGVVAPHHARYARADRVASDQAIEEAYGKNRQSGGRVAVATQTVQQSLDLDADLLITDLCPIDVLLQRIGRLHRHSRARPVDFSAAKVIVLVPEDRDMSRWIRNDGSALGPHGLGTVYSDLRILEATRRLLEKDPVLQVPAGCRAAVERTTHPDALRAVVADLGGSWASHSRHVTGHTLSHRQVASLNLLRRDRAFDDPDVCFPDQELERHIRTRLGEGDRLALFEPALSGPFGNVVECLTLPAHMTRSAGPDETPRDTAPVEGGFYFRFGAGRYRYDRLGLRLLDTDPTGTEDDPDE